MPIVRNGQILIEPVFPLVMALALRRYNLLVPMLLWVVSVFIDLFQLQK